MPNLIEVHGVKDVEAMLNPARFGRAWIGGLEVAAERARERAREEASRHQRYRGRMARKPRYVIKPKGVEQSGNARAMLSAYAVVDPGIGTPESYILSFGHRSKKFPRVDSIARWAVARGFVEGTSRNLVTNRMKFGEGGRAAAVQRGKRVAFLIARAIQKRGFNLGGRGGSTDNWWWRATDSLLAGQVRSDVEKAIQTW